MKRLIVFFVGVIWLSPTYSWSDPSPEIRWLQNEPVTLFDLGMIRAEKDLKTIADHIKHLSIRFTRQNKNALNGNGFIISNALYIFENNSLKLQFTFFNTQKNPLTVEFCKKGIETIQDTILRDYKDTYGKKKSAELIIRDWFSHSGFQGVSRPKNLEQRVSSLTTISLDIIHPNISCSIPLAGDMISVTPKKTGDF